MRLKLTVSGDTLSLYDANELILSIKEVIDDNDPDTVILMLSGKLTSDTDHDFYDEMMAFSSIGKNIVLDFSKVSYIAASCMRSILRIQQSIDKQGHGSLFLRKMTDAIYNEFKNTGLAELLKIK